MHVGWAQGTPEQISKLPTALFPIPKTPSGRWVLDLLQVPSMNRACLQQALLSFFAFCLSFLIALGISYIRAVCCRRRRGGEAELAEIDSREPQVEGGNAATYGYPRSTRGGCPQ